MARYRKIDSRIWNDQKFRELSDSAKLMFFMLLTHPSMTALGAMRGTLSGLAEEIGWEPEAFREAFREALSKGMAEHDPKAAFIGLPNFLKYNPPESPNVVKAWVSALDLIPECSLKTRAIARAKAFTEGLGEAFQKAFREAFAKAIPNQEQEQEQEQEQKKLVSEELRSSSGTSVPAGSPAKPEKTSRKPKPAGEGSDVESHETRIVEVVLDCYHRILPNCRRAEALTGKRRRAILNANKLAKALLKRMGWQDMTVRQFWTAYFEECSFDPWLRGDEPNPKNPSWKQNIETLVDEKRFSQIMDQAIERHRAQGSAAGGDQPDLLDKAA